MAVRVPGRVPCGPACGERSQRSSSMKARRWASRQPTPSPGTSTLKCRPSEPNWGDPNPGEPNRIAPFPVAPASRSTATASSTSGSRSGGSGAVISSRGTMPPASLPSQAAPAGLGRSRRLPAWRWGWVWRRSSSTARSPISVPRIVKAWGSSSSGRPPSRTARIRAASATPMPMNSISTPTCRTVPPAVRAVGRASKRDPTAKSGISPSRRTGGSPPHGRRPAGWSARLPAPGSRPAPGPRAPCAACPGAPARRGRP